jgi:hypothetical protein
MSETETNEETEPQAEEEFDNPGIEGQILYPDPEVDAEHASAFAGGKEDSLYPDGDPRNDGWTNPADRSSEVTEEDEGDQEDVRE